MAVPKLNLGMDLGGILDKSFVAGKFILYALIIGGIIFLLMWMFSYKTRIILLYPRVATIRARFVRKKDGTKFMKLLPDTIKFNGIRYPVPEEELAMYSKKGNKVYCGYKAEDGQIHWLNPNEYADKDGIRIVPVDYYNWLFIRGKERIDRYKKKQSIQGLLLGVGIIVFIVMVAVTFMYLFKNAPKSIAVTIAQTASNIIPPA